jgi:PAS domain S-box-containing protein
MDGAESGLEGLLWFVFRRSANAMVLADEDRRFVEANDAALQLLGRKREELIGTPVVDTITPSEHGRSAREWQAFMRSGEHTGTRKVVRADGSEVQIEVAARFLQVGGRRLAVSVTLATSDSPVVPQAARTRHGALTNREREIVTLIALGHETSQIADVRAHRLGRDLQPDRGRAAGLARDGAHARPQRDVQARRAHARAAGCDRALQRRDDERALPGELTATGPEMLVDRCCSGLWHRLGLHARP